MMSGARMLAEYRGYLVRRNYACGTVRDRCRVARSWLELMGDSWLDADHRDVERWLDSLPVVVASRRNYLSMLRSFYRWLVRERLAPADVTVLVDSPRCGSRLPRPAQDYEIALVLAEVDHQLGTMIALMACGGLRCCEVAGLRWLDVRLHEGTVHVTGKGSKDRVVALSDDVVRMLAALDTTDGYVFVGRRDGHRFSANKMSRMVCLAFRDRGFGTTAHQLRHRAATAALQVDGSDVLVVRDFLGHASVSTTQIYTKVIPGRVARTSRALGLPAMLTS